MHWFIEMHFDLNMLLLQFINNVETVMFGRGFHAKLIPEGRVIGFRMLGIKFYIHSTKKESGHLFYLNFIMYYPNRWSVSYIK